MKYLVFSDAFEDGQLLTTDQYGQLLAIMTREDFETHQAIQVCESLVELTNQVLSELKGVNQ